MKKYIVLAALVLTSCYKDTYVDTDIVIVPESLEIVDLQGIKLESNIVQNSVRINTKTTMTGKYRIKIKDFSNKVINQEILNADEGNNILNIYVTSLPKSSYTVELYDNSNNFIGKEFFAIQ